MASTMFSNETWKNWEKSGKNEFLKVCKGILKSCDDSLLTSNQNTQSISRAMYDLFTNVASGSIRKDSAVSVLSELTNVHPDFASLALDVLNILDVETTCQEKPEERERLCLFAKESEKVLSDLLMKERLEMDSLQDFGVLKDKKMFYTRFIKVKTKLFYKQQKFNLYREESEGYAKLVTELNQEVEGCVSPSYMQDVIKSLIGCFNLDPNRVLDVILESFECRPDLHAQFFIPIIQSYMADPQTLSEVLGFKFKSYQSSLDETTPTSLYTITALMIQHKLISAEDIYVWLAPEDKTIQEAAQKELAEAKEYARKLGIVSTVTKEEEKMEEDIEDPKEIYARNQKFGLCEALLNIGAWAAGQAMLSRLPEFYTISHAPIAKACCELIHATLEPIYRERCRLFGSMKGRVVPPLPYSWAPKPVTTLIEFKTTVVPMLCLLGPHAHTDPLLLYKVVRIAKSALAEMGSAEIKTAPREESLYYDILTLMDDVVLPSLSLLDSNCCFAEEVWSVLKQYPYQHRYRVYGLWKNETVLIHSLLIRKKADSIKRIKSIMKRVSKENVKPTGRVLGKLSHSVPGFLFDYVLSQLQLYDNLIGPVVDSLKYLTGLSYDVLGYCLLEALSHPDKEKTKTDGTSISPWLTALAAFTGTVFKKYNIELTGLLQYVANQLKAKKSLDLLILKEIIHKMAGIEAAEEMTSEQLEAMQGGDLLRTEAGYFSQVRNTKKSSTRLKDVLIEHELAVSMCLLIAQQRNCVIYQETESSHLKLVGKLYDQCQDTLVQFGTFLAANLSVDDYISRFPPLSSLLQDYYISSDVAFFLTRPMFAHAITQKFDEMRRADKNYRSLSTAQKHAKYLEVCEAVMQPVTEAVRPLHSPRIWEDLSPSFYATFWSLTMYDLQVPSPAYEREVLRVKALQSQNAEAKDVLASKKKKEQDRYTALIEKLQDEERRQKEHTERVMARLRAEKDTWFLCRSAKTAKTETITQFLQLCLFPRCLFTASDAIYCSRFVEVMHQLKTPNFSTLICYDRIFCDITYTVTMCTENEANRYGKFLCAMLETVMRWHSSKAVFEKECAQYPGFVTKFRVGNQPSETNDHVDFENYRHVCHKWHHKIAKALVVCLDSKDYVQIRNALLVLIRIIPYFPLLLPLAKVVENKVEMVRAEQKEKRPDIFVLATSYSGLLKTRKSAMMQESDFHVVSRKPAPKPAPTEAAPEKPPTDATVNGVDKVPAVKQEAANPAATNGTKEKPAVTKEMRAERFKEAVKKDDDTKKRSKDKREERDDRKEREDDRERVREGEDGEWTEREAVRDGPEEKDTKRRRTDLGSVPLATPLAKSPERNRDRERSRGTSGKDKDRQRNQRSTETTPSSGSGLKETIDSEDDWDKEEERDKKEKRAKRDRNDRLVEEPVEVKRWKEDKEEKVRSQNGSPSDSNDKRSTREVNYSRDREDRHVERSDRSDRDKHRRAEAKRR